MASRPERDEKHELTEIYDASAELRLIHNADDYYLRGIDMDSTLLLTVLAAIVVGLVILALYRKCLKVSSFDRALIGSMILCAIVVIALVIIGNLEGLYAVLIAFIWWALTVLMLGEGCEKKITA